MLQSLSKEVPPEFWEDLVFKMIGFAVCYAIASYIWPLYAVIAYYTTPAFKDFTKICHLRQTPILKRIFPFAQENGSTYNSLQAPPSKNESQKFLFFNYFFSFLKVDILIKNRNLSRSYISIIHDIWSTFRFLPN